MYTMIFDSHNINGKTPHDRYIRWAAIHHGLYVITYENSHYRRYQSDKGYSIKIRYQFKETQKLSEVMKNA